MCREQSQDNGEPLPNPRIFKSFLRKDESFTDSQLQADWLGVSQEAQALDGNSPFGAMNLTDDLTSNFAIGTTESTAVSFTAFGIETGQTGVANTGGGSTYSANLSALPGAPTSSSPVATDSAGNETSPGSAASQGVNPALSFDGTNPSHAVFTVSGLEGDESGTVTFTDASGRQDVVNIGSNGTYSANLSNLTNGAITYLMRVTDSAGNVITVDPPVNLGDGSANAPAGTSQFSNLLSGYAARPSWNVAGVDYAVGYATGTVLKDPETAALPNGVSRDSVNHILTITGDNVVLSGFNFSLEGGWQIIATNANNPTIEDNYFKIGTNNYQPISLYGGPNGYTGSGATIVNNIIDGAGANIGGSGLIDGVDEVAQSTFNTICWKTPALTISTTMQAYRSSTVFKIRPTFRTTSFIRSMLQVANTHPDWIQTFAGATYSYMTVNYNTVIQTQFGDGTQGFTLQGNTNTPYATFGGGSVSNNTIVVPTFASSTLEATSLRFPLTQRPSPTVRGSLATIDFDPTGAFLTDPAAAAVSIVTSQTETLLVPITAR